MATDVGRDPVFGEVARALQPRALGLAALPHDGDRGMAEIAVWTQAIGADTFDETAEWLGRMTEKHVYALRKVDARTRETRVVVDEGLLRTDSLLFPAPLALHAAHENRSRAPGPVRLMGVVNVTPDSFSDGGRFLDPELAIAHGLALESQGAHILDVGGESTRPGSEPVDVDQELRRAIPVVEGLAKRSNSPISIDTTKSAVARAALDAGATIVNDISAGRFDDGMLPLVAKRGATFVAMHMQGTPRDMQQDPRYGDVVAEVLEFLRERGAACLSAGIARDKIWIDPGIGFGKTLEHNLEILRRLPELRSLGLPLLVGVSRKAFIARIHSPAKDDVARLGGTAAAVALAVQGGAEILRVHDVAVMAEAAAVARAIVSAPDTSPS